MRLKWLTLMLGETNLRMTNNKINTDGTSVSQPIEFDAVSKQVTHHMEGNKKRILDLSKVLMYEYEAE